MKVRSFLKRRGALRMTVGLVLAGFGSVNFVQQIWWPVVETFPPGLHNFCQAIRITAESGRVLMAEVAATDVRREIGLSGRGRLNEGWGMVFTFAHPQEVQMWMKDTLMPLDIIFVEPGGRLLHRHDDAAPMSEAPIMSGGDAIAVIETAPGYFPDGRGAQFWFDCVMSE